MTPDSPMLQEENCYKIGSCYKALSELTVREGEELDSRAVVNFDPDTVIRVLEIGSVGSRRLHVSNQNGSYCGWISCISKSGDPLISQQPYKEPITSIAPAVFAE